MWSSYLLGLIGLYIAGIIAGSINAVAGGGTLISFPSLVGLGESEIIANATNTAALWPGSFSSAIGYRKDTSVDRGLLIGLLIPSFIGGALGAIILVFTPPNIFKVVVPFLVLFATLILALRNTLTRKIGERLTVAEDHKTLAGRLWGFFFQLFVATYGGYFGAGMGILMLGSLSIMGMRDIHEMNALKTPLQAVINMTAFVFFALKGLVSWQSAIVLCIGAITGGYGGARLAKRVDPRILNAGVVALGLIVSAWLLYKAFI
ncbi:MAG TPA: sulfite exporter TauE/SafE family protein [Terriglobales bacterium]|nr:sulfite exporter TauE/SafE family protein [Terriglobales bacterium]